MNPDQLLAQFDKVAEAPDAIPRLRRFILDLAVRGKLVPQDPDDEPASELLKRITSEKGRLVKEKKIKKPKALTPLKNNEVPFELPSSWEWEKLGNVFIYDAGEKTDPIRLKNDLWLLELEDVEKNTGRVVQFLTVNDRESKSTKSMFRSGDVLYGKLRPYLNKVVVAEQEGYSTTEIVAIRSAGRTCFPAYTALALRRPDFVSYVEEKGKGTKMPRLRTEDALNSVFPLPPLAEQKRIVAKVDELMALCDQLEAAQAKHNQQRDRLVAATHHQINSPESDPKAIVDFFFNHDNFTQHTARPEHINLFRQTILNLAVRGKLVPQDSNDEPASELLKRIAAEKERLFKEKKIKKPKVLPKITVDEASATLPPSWNWVYLFDLSSQIHYGYTASANPKISDVRLLRITDIQDNQVNWITVPGCEISSKLIDQYKLRERDILIARTGGTIGKSYLIKDVPVVSVFASYLIRVCPLSGVDENYIKLFLESPIYWKQLIDGSRGAGQPNVNGQTLGKLLISLPPLAEQKRIVAKVDELMALCDQLEVQLKSTQTHSQQLLEACLREAIA